MIPEKDIFQLKIYLKHENFAIKSLSKLLGRLLIYDSYIYKFGSFSLIIENNGIFVKV